VSLEVVKKYYGKGKIIILVLSGTLNRLTSDVYVREVKQVITGNKYQIIVDMSNVLSIDSTGLAAIVMTCRDALSNQVRFLITGINGKPRELFKTLGLLKILNTDIDLPEESELRVIGRVNYGVNSI
jgi:anti-anti-sigma factor